MSISKHQQLLSTPDGEKAFVAAVKDLMDLISNLVAAGNARLLDFSVQYAIFYINIFTDNEADGIHLLSEIICSLQTHGELVSK